MITRTSNLSLVPSWKPSCWSLEASLPWERASYPRCRKSFRETSFFPQLVAWLTQPLSFPESRVFPLIWRSRPSTQVFSTHSPSLVRRSRQLEDQSSCCLPGFPRAPPPHSIECQHWKEGQKRRLRPQRAPDQQWERLVGGLLTPGPTAVHILSGFPESCKGLPFLDTYCVPSSQSDAREQAVHRASRLHSYSPPTPGRAHLPGEAPLVREVVDLTLRKSPTWSWKLTSRPPHPCPPGGQACVHLIWHFPCLMSQLTFLVITQFLGSWGLASPSSVWCRGWTLPPEVINSNAIQLQVHIRVKWGEREAMENGGDWGEWENTCPI